MNRRSFVLALAAGAFATPWSVLAQPASGKTVRVGWLSPGTQASQVVLLDQLRKGFRDLGYVEGKNLTIEARFADGKPERLALLAKELAALKVHAIVTAFTPSALAAKQVVTDVPVVFTLVGSPRQMGLIQDLARPGGNVTGLSSVNIDLASKRLEIFRELLPKVSRIGFVYRKDNIVDRAKLDETTKAAAQLGLQIVAVDTEGTQYAQAFERILKGGMHAAIVTFNPSSFDNRRLIVDLARKHALPVMYEMAAFVDEGGLMSYSVSQYAQITRAATYVDKIVKGTNPGDLPVEQPAILETVINLKNAKALGIKLPTSVLLRADRVIE